MEEEPDLPALFETQCEIKKTNKLFQLKVRSNIKAQKRVEDIPHMSTTHPPRCIAISTESWTVCTKLFKNSF